MTDVIVLAKRPEPGRVKTRLTPPLSPADAAAVAAAALSDTLDVVDSLAARRRVLCFAGDPSDWLRPGWRGVRQVAGELDLRLAAALLRSGSRPAVLIGMDTPQVTAAQLAAFRPDRFDACFGPATDGGFWALGLARPSRHAAAAVRGVPMSRADTGAVQLRRLRSLGLRVQVLDELTDVDTIASAHAVAALAPGGAFAAALAAAEPAVPAVP